jgi:hypothetical protein
MMEAFRMIAEIAGIARNRRDRKGEFGEIARNQDEIG